MRVSFWKAFFYNHEFSIKGVFNVFCRRVCMYLLSNYGYFEKFCWKFYIIFCSLKTVRSVTYVQSIRIMEEEYRNEKVIISLEVLSFLDDSPSLATPRIFFIFFIFFILILIFYFLFLNIRCFYFRYFFWS